MLKVALTGGIATGKSYVLLKLRERGVPTIDADDIVHEALGSNTATAKAIAIQFGKSILKKDGSVDRARLAGVVFADADARLRLEAIVHPWVYEAIRDWFATGRQPFGVASIPLLYETHREADFGVVVVTACKPEQQLKRIMERGLSEAEAKQRMAAQMPTEDKAKRADYVIWTSGSFAETAAQVDELLIKLGGVSRSAIVDRQ
jgi:dephospho-CoA kinase